MKETAIGSYGKEEKRDGSRCETVIDGYGEGRNGRRRARVTAMKRSEQGDDGSARSRQATEN